MQERSSGSGQVVSVLDSHSDNTTLNPIEVYSFFQKNCVEKSENK